ncbi:uncharacterized protein G2W53_016775 [Senna tora]|uniref:Uncharacterized protein n=1 Tax=Senna tora TaxID=362788 RepID=A0A834TRJ8_9FABA|nr:uncharacterized protein G2W53_016775 [Senna tora]
MGGNKQVGSSSSSLTSELFGSKESVPSSSSGIFDSIFSPPSNSKVVISFTRASAFVYFNSFAVLGRESLRSEVSGKTPSDPWSSQTETTDHSSGINVNDSETQRTEDKDLSSIYQDQRVPPSTLSSSIYYGGQDIYVPPKTRRKWGKMIQDLPLEATGGKDLCIIKITLANRNAYEEVELWRHGWILTSALVTDGAVSEVAALGDGEGDLRLDAGVFGGVREHDSAEAARVLPNSLDLSTATLRDTSTCILCC